MKLELWYPLDKFVISQKFGLNADYYGRNYRQAGHAGWDMVGGYGQICRAAHDGVVVFSGYDGSAGLGIVIRTLQPFDYDGGNFYFKTIFWHLKDGSILVKPGDKVEAGQAIAQCNGTGILIGIDGFNLGTKESVSHLHFGLKPIQQGENEWTWANVEQTNGYFGAIDPEPYWNGKYARVVPEARSLIARLTAFIASLKGRSS